MPQLRNARRSHVRFNGGMDTETPRWNVDPGRVQTSLNYECGVQNGYRDVQGFERYDGRPSPSDEKFLSIAIDGDALSNYKEFGNENGPSLTGQRITTYGDYYELFELSEEAESVALFASGLTGLVVDGQFPDGTGYTRVLTGTDVIQFRDSFLSFFAGEPTNGVMLSMEALFLDDPSESDALIHIESEYDGVWTTRSTIDFTSVNISTIGKGDVVVDNGGVAYNATRDGGWRLFAANIPPESTGIRLRFEGTSSFTDIRLCCVSLTYRSLLESSAYATVIGTDEIVTGGAAGKRICVADVDGEFRPEAHIFLDGRPTTPITTIQGNRIVQLEASTRELGADLLALAADTKRDYIGAVPGEGPVLGIWQLGHDTYVVRNVHDNTEAAIYRSSSEGWVRVELGYEADFANGTRDLLTEGTTLYQGVNEFTLDRRSIEGGSITGADNEGRLVISGDVAPVDGALYTENPNVNKACDIAESQKIVLLPNTEDEPSKYETVKSDFGTGYKIYGCDRKNTAFEFDGSVYFPIRTAWETNPYGDRPRHITSFQNHLFLSFDSNVSHSGVGLPLSFDTLDGAHTFATQGKVTGFLVEPGEHGGGALAIFNRDRIFVLYGTSEIDFQMVRYREEVGAYEGSIQEVTDTVFLDDRGLRKLQTVQAFGNFQHATISEHCRSFLQETGRFGESNVVGSYLVRQKNQYRVHFKDGYGLAVTFDMHKPLGIMPLNFGIDASFVYSSEDGFGRERIFMGSTDGFVYELEKGTSFDGRPISAFLLTHYHFPDNTIGWKKRYHSMIVEGEGTAYADFDVSTILDYNLTQFAERPTFEEVVNHVSAFWDHAFWDEFYWDGRAIGPAHVKMHGKGENVAVLIRKKSKSYTPLLLSGVNLRYSYSNEVR